MNGDNLAPLVVALTGLLTATWAIVQGRKASHDAKAKADRAEAEALATKEQSARKDYVEEALAGFQAIVSRQDDEIKELRHMNERCEARADKQAIQITDLRIELAKVQGKQERTPPP